jgi:hypothetical protein
MNTRNHSRRREWFFANTPESGAKFSPTGGSDIMLTTLYHGYAGIGEHLYYYLSRTIFLDRLSLPAISL